MRKGIHPDTYRLVAIKDMSNEEVFITLSCASRETLNVDGVDYPLIKVEISNTSHPFYTGKSMLLILLVVSKNSRNVTRKKDKSSFLYNIKSDSNILSRFFYEVKVRMRNPQWCNEFHLQTIFTISLFQHNHLFHTRTLSSIGNNFIEIHPTSH